MPCGHQQSTGCAGRGAAAAAAGVGSGGCFVDGRNLRIRFIRRFCFAFFRALAFFVGTDVVGTAVVGAAVAGAPVVGAEVVGARRGGLCSISTSHVGSGGREVGAESSQVSIDGSGTAPSMSGQNASK